MLYWFTFSYLKSKPVEWLLLLIARMLSTSGQKKMVVSSTVEDITKEITMKGVEEQIQEEEKK